jgi:hypothetical protein
VYGRVGDLLTNPLGFWRSLAPRDDGARGGVCAVAIGLRGPGCATAERAIRHGPARDQPGDAGWGEPALLAPALVYLYTKSCINLIYKFNKTLSYY